MSIVRQKAEILRDQGYSYELIHEKLGIAKGTMSYWFKERPFTPNSEVLSRIKNGPSAGGLKLHNRRVKEITELRELGINEIGKLTKRDLMLLGIGLYIGEGSKTTEAVRISNSNPLVIIVFIRWLTEICGLSIDNITIRLHRYPDNIEKKCIKYWQNVTGIPRSNFRKTQIDQRIKKNLNIGKLPYGTVHLSVVAKGDSLKGVKLYRKIDGWITGALQ